jgi:MFS family permease
MTVNNKTSNMISDGANNEFTHVGIKLYLIALIFALIAIFNQSLPLGTSQHFEITLSIPSTSLIYLTSAFFVTYSIMQIPGGLVLDTAGSKIVLPTGILISLIGFIIFWFAKSPTFIVVGRLISGFGCSIAYICGIFIATRFFSHRNLALLIGILESVSTLGSILAASPLHHAIEKLGWNQLGYILVTLGVIFSIISYYYSFKLAKLSSKMAKPQTKPIKQILIEARSLFHNKVAVYIFLYSFFTWMIIMSFAGFWLKKYLHYMHHFGEVSSLNIVSVYWLSFFFSGLSLGFLVRKFNNLTLIVQILATIGFLTYLLMFIPVLFSFNLLILVFILAGISASGVIIAFAIIPTFVEKHLQSTAVAVNNTFIVIGGYIGQLIFGIILSSQNTLYNQAIDNVLSFHHIHYKYYIALALYVVAAGLALIFSILVANRLRLRAV